MEKGKEEVWIILPDIQKLFVFPANPIADALVAYRKGKIHKAVRHLEGAKAYIVYVKEPLLRAVEEAADPEERLLFRGSLDELFASDQVEAVYEATLGILLEGDVDEEDDLPLTLRRIPSDLKEIYQRWGQGDEVFSFFAYRDLFAYLPEEPVTTFPFPGLRGEEEEEEG